ncbi:MAG: hypothetical protein LBR77_07145 [Lachnospiraceae bacterium]|jgi:vacuolar-type H+-ATPase subunit H|nr:hypothetical protein [Lachnospiraceae bacterium]
MSILDSITQAEQKAEEAKQRALAQAREMVREAEGEAARESEQVLAQAKQEAQILLEGARRNAEEETKKFMAARSSEDAIQAALSKENLAKAAAFIVDKIENR